MAELEHGGEWWVKEASEGRRLFVRVVETAPIPSGLNDNAATTALLEYHAGDRWAAVQLTQRYSTVEKARRILRGRGFAPVLLAAPVVMNGGGDVV